MSVRTFTDDEIAQLAAELRDPVRFGLPGLLLVRVSRAYAEIGNAGVASDLSTLADIVTRDREEPHPHG